MSELDAIEKIYVILDEFGLDTKLRIISWLRSRIDTDERDKMLSPTITK